MVNFGTQKKTAFHQNAQIKKGLWPSGYLFPVWVSCHLCADICPASSCYPSCLIVSTMQMWAFVTVSVCLRRSSFSSLSVIPSMSSPYHCFCPLSGWPQPYPSDGVTFLPPFPPCSGPDCGLGPGGWHERDDDLRRRLQNQEGHVPHGQPTLQGAAVQAYGHAPKHQPQLCSLHHPQPRETGEWGQEGLEITPDNSVPWGRLSSCLWDMGLWDC